MGLNDIELPASLVADLYKNALVQLDVHAPSVEQAAPSNTSPGTTELPPESWKSLGNNRRQILIVVNYTDVLHLPDETLGFLTSMLTACKLSLDDVALINMQHYLGVSAREILAHFKTKQALLFGIEPAEFGLAVSFPEFQVQSVANAVFLYSPALEAIQPDKLLKSKLWICLQRMFLA